MKRTIKKRKQQIRKRLYFSQGKMGVGIIIVFLAITFALFLTGGFFTPRQIPPGTGTETASTNSEGSNLCCDSGDGDACKPKEDKKISYNNQDYGLIKSNVTLTEGVYHMKDTGEKVDDGPIIVNSTEGYSYNTVECGSGINDQVWGQFGCVPLPDDEVVYVCRKNCEAGTATYCSLPTVSCYGKADTVYDVYFKLADYPNPGVPDVIKNCPKTVSTQNISQGGQLIVPPSGEQGTANLHINTFKVANLEAQKNSTPWLSPYCKPAIYLYPEEKSDISVKINPKGKLTLTIPTYPANGWNVTAYPDGKISYQNAVYNYLYYEAQIPNDSYQKPTEGFVYKKEELGKKLDVLLTQLGLSKNEKDEFVEYWVHALPKSPYYFVGIIPTSTLDTVSPLSFSPSPKTVIRVTLYFQALDSQISVKEPSLITPIRSGFTVVEWGGIFKRDPNHPFSCFM